MHRMGPFAAAGAFAALSLWSGAAAANMASTPWIHSLFQDEADVVIEFAVFAETDAVNGEGAPLPGPEAAYTLRRLAPYEDAVDVFADRAFDPAAAEATSGYACQPWSRWESGPCDGSIDCVDCDDDGVEECDGFCGVAYYYTVVDECPPLPDGEILYSVHTAPAYDLFYEGEGLGFEATALEDVGAACQRPADGGCSVAGPGAAPPAGPLALLAVVFG